MLITILTKYVNLNPFTPEADNLCQQLQCSFRLIKLKNPEKVSDTRKMFINENPPAFQMIQKELDLNFGFAVIHKIIYEELYTKKFVCRCFLHILTDE